jgi:hypothetical protein
MRARRRAPATAGRQSEGRQVLRQLVHCREARTLRVALATRRLALVLLESSQREGRLLSRNGEWPSLPENLRTVRSQKDGGSMGGGRAGRAGQAAAVSGGAVG